MEREFTMKITAFHGCDARIGRFSWNDEPLFIHNDTFHGVVDVVVVEIFIVAPVIRSVVLIVVRFGNHSSAFFVCTHTHTHGYRDTRKSRAKIKT